MKVSYWAYSMKNRVIPQHNINWVEIEANDFSCSCSDCVHIANLKYFMRLVRMQHIGCTATRGFPLWLAAADKWAASRRLPLVINTLCLTSDSCSRLVSLFPANGDDTEPIYFGVDLKTSRSRDGTNNTSSWLTESACVAWQDKDGPFSSSAQVGNVLVQCIDWLDSHLIVLSCVKKSNKNKCPQLKYAQSPRKCDQFALLQKCSPLFAEPITLPAKTNMFGRGWKERGKTRGGRSQCVATGCCHLPGRGLSALCAELCNKISRWTFFNIVRLMAQLSRSYLNIKRKLKRCHELPPSLRRHSILCACVSLLLAASCSLCSSAKRGKAPEPHCFLGKLPEASVEEMRWVGACRLKYLQRRDAMASFIRCLALQTRKLSAVLNQSQILFFIWHSHIYFAPSSFFLFFFKGIISLLEIAHTLTPRFTRIRFGRKQETKLTPLDNIRNSTDAVSNVFHVNLAKLALFQWAAACLTMEREREKTTTI